MRVVVLLVESHLNTDQSMTCDRENTAVYSRPGNQQFTLLSPQSLQQFRSYLETLVVAATALITQLSTVLWTALTLPIAFPGSSSLALSVATADFPVGAKIAARLAVRTKVVSRTTNLL